MSLTDKDGIEHQVDATPWLTANDPKVIHRMVLNGAGITATAKYIAEPEIEEGSLVRILPGWRVPSVDVSLVMPAGKERNAAVRAFVDFVRKSATTKGRWFDV
jgi:DNA-binding transcriptional LysR family regulator